MNYGYEDEVLLPVADPGRRPSAKPGQTVTLKADAAFLVCADICVPEDASLTLDLPVAAGRAAPDPKWGRSIGDALAAAPKAGGLTARLRQPRPTRCGWPSPARPPLKGADLADAYFFPFDGAVIDHAKPAGDRARPRGPDPDASPPATPSARDRRPTALAGVLVVDGKAYEVTAAAGALPAGAAGPRRRRRRRPPAPAPGADLGHRPGAGLRLPRRPDPQPDALRLPGAVA